ncbi:PTS fructose transporter subunit IIA [Tetragenococcus halophilus]|uniref:PTS sugar transporter subunit IIA n=1 Tax=Tetragenococcus halophilus TaxID=51669 RepID=UPI0021BABF54|nr:PTS fructose transporter subunit IIA [Tetragenococcus halophilus]MCT8310836.1 PTS fructose transporter subunit IIA [Tetragenococcus halophilus]
MSFNIAIIGHGNYPEGILSALELLAGSDNHIHTFNLNENITHDEFTEEIRTFLEEHEEVLIFADMTGGAPHQIASRLLLELGKNDQYIISSAPLNLILDLYASSKMDFLKENVNERINLSIQESKELIQVLSSQNDNFSFDETSGSDDTQEEGI